MRRYRAVELFAGFGGATTGADTAGADVVRSYELSDEAAAWHEANHPGVCRVADVTTLDWQHEAQLSGPIDLLMASPSWTTHTTTSKEV